MSFLLRRHYGYTESEICDFIELYGMEWVYSAYKEAMEAEYSARLWQLHSSVAARTPQTKEGSRAMNKHTKSMYKVAESYVPWLNKRVKASATREEKIRRRVANVPEPRIIVEGQGLPPEVMEFVASIKDVNTENRTGM